MLTLFWVIRWDLQILNTLLSLGSNMTLFCTQRDGLLWVSGCPTTGFTLTFPIHLPSPTGSSTDGHQSLGALKFNKHPELPRHTSTSIYISGKTSLSFSFSFSRCVESVLPIFTTCSRYILPCSTSFSTLFLSLTIPLII